MNPRVDIDLLVFEARPLSHLGTPPKRYSKLLLDFVAQNKLEVYLNVFQINVFKNESFSKHFFNLYNIITNIFRNANEKSCDR